MKKTLLTAVVGLAVGIAANSFAGWDPDEAEEYHAKAQEAMVISHLPRPGVTVSKALAVSAAPT